MTSPAEVKARLDAERRGVPFLLYRDGDGAQVIVALDGPVTVGRRPERDVALPWDTEVSRLHAQLEPVGSDWIVVDDGLSRNGTYVNGERVNGRRRLRDGDRMVLRRDAGRTSGRPRTSRRSRRRAIKLGGADAPDQREPAQGADRAVPPAEGLGVRGARRPTRRSPTRSTSPSTPSRRICACSSSGSASTRFRRTQSARGSRPSPWSKGSCASTSSEPVDRCPIRPRFRNGPSR